MQRDERYNVDLATKRGVRVYIVNDFVEIEIYTSTTITMVHFNLTTMVSAPS